MLETKKPQMNTTGHKQTLYIYAFGLFEFGSFEIVSDFVLRILNLVSTGRFHFSLLALQPSNLLAVHSI
jgi:hypothetical protein